MKKYYVMDTENQYRIIENLCCYTADVYKYIIQHNFGEVRNLHEISKAEYSQKKKEGQKVTYKL